MRFAALSLAALVLVIGCSADARLDSPAEPKADELGVYVYPAAPPTDERALGPEIASAWRAVVASLSSGFGDIEQTGGYLDVQALNGLVAGGDARSAWLLSDLLRFAAPGIDTDALSAAFEEVTGVDPSRDPAFADNPWSSITNHLIAWDLPAPPSYRDLKAELYLLVEPGWEPFFADLSSVIDWRLVSWGGVQIDDRPLGDPNRCVRGCIPALDDPTMTPAEEGAWYPDQAIVFGVVEGGDAVALPRNLMEVHELVNMTLGGRRLGIPYCTLCGSAQAYYTDRVPDGAEAAVLRTSGLLSRSNKIMYDLRSQSVFDTFTGRAVSGSLHRAGFALEQTTVVVGTWAEWRAEHPHTRIVARDGGIGRDYALDPLRGRDDDGPIFPIGPVDPRLPVQAQVVGVLTSAGVALAFPVDAARAAHAEGRVVALAGVELVADGGGFRARRDGLELPAHQAFWFAWSQFHPGTAVWAPIHRS